MRPRVFVASVLAGILMAGGLLACREAGIIPRQRVDGGEPVRGERALMRYGCGSCHVVPGVPAAVGRVGPPLTDFADRAYVAGRLRNEPAALVRWIRDPQGVEPGTAMPNLDVTDADARDIAAYLYTLGSRRLGPPHPIPASAIPGH
jgi:cytochrome c